VRVAVPVVKAKGDYFLVPHFGRAPSFAIVEVEGGSYRVVEVFDNPHVTHEHGRGVRLIDDLVEKGVDAVLTLGIGHGAFYRLKAAGVKIYYASPPPGKGTLTLAEAIETLTSGKAEEATEPREAD
jgi:predicted Fe-Mo cluster-binding NifX family protein